MAVEGHRVANVGEEGLELPGDSELVAVVVDPDAGEEGREELALDGTGGGREERVGPGHEVEVAEHHLGVLLEGLGGGVEARADLMLLDLQVAEPGAELVGGEGSVGGEVDEAFFLDVELLQFLLQACALLGVTGEHVVERGVHFPLCVVDGIGGEAEAGELTSERALEFCGREIRQVAEAVLAPSAEEVLVDLVGVILCLGEDEAVFTSNVVTAAAVQHAAGEVIMDAVSLSPFHSSVDDLLDPVEEFRCDERLVSARVDVPFEGDHPEVVRIAENLAKLTARQRTLGPLAGLASRESLLGEQGRELGGAVLAGRVLLEGPADEGRALLVEADCVDQAPVEVLAVVDVAELGATDGAAVFCFVEQLLLDVLSALTHLNFVHDVRDRFHGLRHVAIAEVFFC